MERQITSLEARLTGGNRVKIPCRWESSFQPAASDYDADNRTIQYETASSFSIEQEGTTTVGVQFSSVDDMSYFLDKGIYHLEINAWVDQERNEGDSNANARFEFSR